MTVYAINYYSDFDHHQEWFTSHAAAKKAKSKIIKDIGKESFGDIQKYVIPARKIGLVIWLNAHCNSGESSI